MLTQANLDKLIAEASIRIGTLGIKVITAKPNPDYMMYDPDTDSYQPVTEERWLAYQVWLEDRYEDKISYGGGEVDHVDPRDKWMVTEEALARRRNGEEIYQRGNGVHVRRYWQQERGEL